MAKGKKKKGERERERKKGHNYVGAAQLTAGGSLNQSKQREMLAANECECGEL